MKDKSCILVIDDDPIILKILAHELGDIGELICVASGQEALYVAKIKIPDLIMTDLFMPDMSGYEFITAMKKEEDLKNVPYVIMTGNFDETFEIEGLRRGAADFIKKPFNLSILKQRISNILLSNKEKLKLVTMANTDAMTGAYIRRYIKEHMDTLDRNVSGYFIIVDLDHFKSVNDNYGHDVGDDVICQFYNIIRKLMRDDDIVARIGGDEFAVWCAGINNKSVIESRMAQIVEVTMRELAKYGVTVSLGAVCRPVDGTDFDVLYQKADEALYIVKNSGRSSYHFYSENDANGNASVQEFGAMSVGRDEFALLVEYINRARKRLDIECSKVVFAFDRSNELLHHEDEIDFLQKTLRMSDVIIQRADGRYEVLLSGTSIRMAHAAAHRVISSWRKHGSPGKILRYKVEGLRESDISQTR